MGQSSFCSCSFRKTEDINEVCETKTNCEEPLKKSKYLKLSDDEILLDLNLNDYILFIKLQKYLKKYIVYLRNLKNIKSNKSIINYQNAKFSEGILKNKTKNQVQFNNIISNSNSIIVKKPSINDLNSRFKQVNQSKYTSLNLEENLKISSNKIDYLSNSKKAHSKKNILLVNVDNKIYSIKKTKWEDGSKFVGEVIQNRACGIGIFDHSSGDNYKGYFKDDKSNGFGIYYNKKNLSICYGEWRNDLQNGINIEICYIDKSIYFGNFSNGKKNGLGTYCWSNGSVYKGEWLNGYLNGYGLYVYEDYQSINKTNVYNIIFQNELKYFKVKDFVEFINKYNKYNLHNNKMYKGQWKNNLMHGYGKLFWDTHFYIGEYFEDKKHGFGIYYWYNPLKIYIGQWKNGKQDGIGKLITDKDSKFSLWQEGKKVKWLKNNDIELNDQLRILNDYQKKMFCIDLKDLKKYTLNYLIN